MAESTKPTQDSWSDGVSKLMEAGRTHMTAYNMAAVGVTALVAGSMAYFWDQSRRNAFLDQTHKFTDQMRNAWGFPGMQSSGDHPQPPDQKG